MSRDHQALGHELHEALRRLVRQRLARHPGGHVAEARLRDLELDLRLKLALDGPPASADRFAEELIADIDRQIADAVELAASFRPGHAYCHRCSSSSCGHSTPPAARQVFVGYTPTGMPRWRDFAQDCLDTTHPDVDRLWGDPPALLTVVRDRQALHGGILSAFRNRSYDLLGQVTAGFFTMRPRDDASRAVLALTAQVAVSRRRGKSAGLVLNLIGCEAWDGADEAPWRSAVRWAQTALQTVAVRPARAETRVGGILSGLARRLERGRRGRIRRTRHAEQRHASGERPTPKALDDARATGPAGLLIDERSDTLVVLGDRGRTHFFTRTGRLVSSVRYKREAIERKLKLDLWRPASEKEAATFRGKLTGAVTDGSGDD